MSKASRTMMTNSQSVIAPDVQVFEQQRERQAAIRVAAYCRVSTNLEVQELSLETQMKAYNKIIQDHPGWVLAGIYADQGISGTSVSHRREFLRMIEDAKAGRIQYILAKSISRFSRNTVDLLAYVRELKNYGVSVYFEKERIDTGNIISEFMLSILAAAAQEEIISLSNNVKIGKRMRFAAGIPSWTNIYGFYKGENGEWLVQEEEAAIVRRIFKEYILGRSLTEICRQLMAENVPSPSGKTIWGATALSKIIHNEKYIGDVRMQKSFTIDPIQNIEVNNREAKIRQYYKENHHVAIVDRDVFQMAQEIAAMKDLHRGESQYPYYGILKCPLCGENMVRSSLPRNSRTMGWTCAGKPSEQGNLRRQRTACPPFYILDNYINNAFWTALKSVDSRKLHAIIHDYKARGPVIQMLDLKKRSKRGKIEYWMLRELVESISFPMWTKMQIVWRCGLTSCVEIKYKKLSDIPWPMITKGLAERETVRGKFTLPTYFVNGEIYTKGCVSQQIAGINRAHEYIQNLTILEPRVYEPAIPRVYGGSTSSENEEVETATREIAGLAKAK